MTKLRCRGSLKPQRIGILAGKGCRQLDLEVLPFRAPLERLRVAEKVERGSRLGLNVQERNFGMLGFTQEDGIKVAVLAREANVDAVSGFACSPRPGSRAVNSIPVLM